jgi:hypothetical protein
LFGRRSIASTLQRRWKKVESLFSLFLFFGFKSHMNIFGSLNSFKS